VPLEIRGACGAETTIRSSAPMAIVAFIAAVGVAIRRVTIRGGSAGIGVGIGASLELEDALTQEGAAR